MKKIPTLFRRDPDNLARVLPEVHPDCQWVLYGQGTPTRKYDGTCVMFNGEWWARREVKPDKTPPINYVTQETDPVTGKTVGWQPIEQSPWFKYFREAVSSLSTGDPFGTYELCGPKINGNPEGYETHTLIPHNRAESIDPPRDYEGLRRYLATFPHEGIVWHHPDGRMAKLKRKDFPRYVTKPYAVLIEYSVPDDADLDAIIGPLKSLVNDLPLSIAPVMVTAFAGEDAERIIREHRGE